MTFHFTCQEESVSMPTMAKKKPKPKTVPVYLRLPVVLKQAMEELAEEERRNFSGQVVIAFEEHLQKRGKLPHRSEPE